MLDTENGIMFSPAEPWRTKIKQRTHALNQKYNALTDEKTEERKSVLKEILGDCSIIK